jgi:hypothetical protein
MVGEIFASLGAIKTAFDMAQGLSNIHDAAVRDRAIIELQKEILAAQAAQFALVEQVDTLEKEVIKFETWEAEKKKWELKDLGRGALAYMLKPDCRGTEPPHWACTNCYGNRRISIIQHIRIRGEGREFSCPSCHSSLNPSLDALNNGGYRWLD